MRGAAYSDDLITGHTALNRIRDAFSKLKEEGRTGIAGFLTVGFPEGDSTIPLLRAMAEGGVDFIELGVAFSDPLADGATIQRSSQVALENGITLADCLEACARFRVGFPNVPVLLMGYYNPVLSYGLERFAEDGAQAGLDGLIAVDLPSEEAGPLRSTCAARGIDLIFLLAPTSTDERIQKVCDASSNLIYCVSLTGVTGARREMDPALSGFLRRVRSRTSLPLVVGFGISAREHVEAVGRYAESVVIGSALINLIDSTPPSRRVERLREYVEELAGHKALKV
ncbi:MAG: tryptophan synthase subunit alpha [Dehalococcoidia bacterium]